MPQCGIREMAHFYSTLESDFPFWTYPPAEATSPIETATGFLRN